MLILALLFGCSENSFYAGPGTETLPGDSDITQPNPIAVCGALPEEIEPLEETLLAGSDSYDPLDIPIAQYLWRFISIPANSEVTMPSGNSPNYNIMADVSGEYIAELVVVTEDGRESEPCLAQFHANKIPQVTCSATPEEDSLPNAFIQFHANATDPEGHEIVEYSWQFVEIPEGALSNELTDVSDPTFSPDWPGEYVAEVVVRTDDGRESEPCIANATITAEPPVAVCSVSPETEVFAPFDPVTFIGQYSYDPANVGIEEYDWRFITIPEGSNVEMPISYTSNRTIVPDVEGEYLAELTVTTFDGRESEPCVAKLEAIATPDLWIQLLWSEPYDDMDLHVLAPGGTPRTASDCYFGNCSDGQPWGEAGTADDPFLDVDDISGTGPENIYIVDPQDGIFTVFVHDYPMTNNIENMVTINVYIGGELEWTDTRGISGENTDEYFCEIAWPDEIVTSL